MSPLSPLYEKLSGLITGQGDVALAVRTLDQRIEFRLNAEMVFHAASTMKIAVMLALFYQVERRALRLEQKIPVVNRFTSIIDDSPFTLPLEADEEAQWLQAGAASLYDLCHAMISYSSNLATNLLMQQVGIQTIQSILSSSGLKNMAIVRLLEDIRAFEQGIVNTTTAEALLHQLEAIRDASLFTPASSTLMLDMLKAQRFNDGIPAGLPPGTVVAHKTGEITRHHHDAGVVYGPRPFTLVILTRGVAERSTSARLIAEMAGAVYAAIMRDAAAAPHTTPDND